MNVRHKYYIILLLILIVISNLIIICFENHIKILASLSIITSFIILIIFVKKSFSFKNIFSKSPSSSKAFETDEKYLQLLDISPVGIFLLQDYKAVYSNTKLTELLGYDNINEIIGRPAIEFIHSDFHTITKNRITKALNHIGTRLEPIEEKYLKKDGTAIDVIVVSSSIIYQKRPTLQGFIFDITQKKQLEKELTIRNKELLKQQKELIKARNKALESDKLKSAFLANMSHEIRTPMNSIIGFSSLLAQTIQSDEEKQYAGIINDSCNTLLRLIEDIIDISKIEAGQLSVIKDHYNIFNIVSELHYKFNTTHNNNKSLTFRLSFPEGTENIKLYTDVTRLNQILSNLLSNAFKFTEQGEIEFGYNIITSDKNDEIDFFVNDTGIGINDNDLNIIFDRFHRVANTKSKIYSGTGIGLAIVKSLTDMLGGSIKVISKLGKGSSFHVKFPLEKI